MSVIASAKLTDDEEENFKEENFSGLMDTNIKVESKTMRAALIAIAQEMETFRSTSTSDSNNNDIKQYVNVFDKLKMYKDNLRLKVKEIKKLKEKLRTACLIAKTVIMAKENETISLNNQIECARNETATLMKTSAENFEVIQRISTEKQVIYEQLQNFQSLINLGYKELQKMRNESENELPLLKKLKHIMVCCGQYYADYCNERDKCTQLEQRNRFLNNKLKILENNLESVNAELKTLQKQKFLKEKNLVKDKQTKSEPLNDNLKVGFAYSDCQFGQQSNVARIPVENVEPLIKAGNKNKPIHKPQNLDLGSHLSLVKNLLNYQDTMLDDLRKLSLELSVLEF